MSGIKKSVDALIQQVLKSEPVPENPRRMKYPLTFSARIAQFPLRYHLQNSWVFRWYGVGWLTTLYLFSKITDAVKSPEYVASYYGKEKAKAEKAKEARDFLGPNYGGHH